MHSHCNFNNPPYVGMRRSLDMKRDVRLLNAAICVTAFCISQCCTIHKRPSNRSMRDNSQPQSLSQLTQGAVDLF